MVGVAHLEVQHLLVAVEAAATDPRHDLLQLGAEAEARGGLEAGGGRCRSRGCRRTPGRRPRIVTGDAALREAERDGHADRPAPTMTTGRVSSAGVIDAKSEAGYFLGW
ncbi:hypothetical protein GS421_05685 [Rhodococcus hoagii]|nr:hypothetical protein [Prescottella equi]